MSGRDPRTIADRHDQLDRFETALRSAELAQNSIRTCVDRSRYFVRWLDGDFEYRPITVAGCTIKESSRGRLRSKTIESAARNSCSACPDGFPALTRSCSSLDDEDVTWDRAPRRARIDAGTQAGEASPYNTGI